MSLQSVLPTVRTLSRGEKFRLIQLLVDDLSENEPATEAGFPCEVWSPCTDFTGAQKLLEFLQTQEKPS